MQSKDILAFHQKARTMAIGMQGFGTYEQDDRGRLCYRPPSAPPFPKMEIVWKPYERALTAVNAFDQALNEFPISGVIAACSPGWMPSIHPAPRVRPRHLPT